MDEIIDESQCPSWFPITTEIRNVWHHINELRVSLASFQEKNHRIRREQKKLLV